jgi:hypothetical protein
LIARWSPKLGTFSNYQTVSLRTPVNKGIRKDRRQEETCQEAVTR